MVLRVNKTLGHRIYAFSNLCCRMSSSFPKASARRKTRRTRKKKKKKKETEKETETEG